MILKPCDYLRITWKDGDKRKFDWFYATVVAIIFSLSLIIFSILAPEHIDPSSAPDPTSNIFFKSKAFELLTGFLQTMPGFYVAALAAIATFTNPDMDKLMLGDNPPKDAGNLIMTRRRFLSQAFAYLTFLSICLFILSAMFKYMYEIAVFPVNNYIFYSVYGICTFTVFLFFTQMILVTFLCLYYLGDRIHVP
jgi:hypothetical protein